jgi:uncharacterized cupin superfamily protein
MAHVSPFGVRRVRASSDRPATPTRLRFPTRSMSLGLAGLLGFEASRLSVFIGVEPISRTKIEFASDERFISLRRALGVGSFGINQLTLQPGQRGRIHRHREQEEVYLVVRGALALLVEEEEFELTEGELARVAPALRRQLVNRSSTPCIVVAIGGAGEHVGRDGEAFNDWREREGRPPQEIPLPADVPHLSS